MDEMTSDYEAQRFALMQAVSEQVILPSQLKALYPNKVAELMDSGLPVTVTKQREAKVIVYKLHPDR